MIATHIITLPDDLRRIVMTDRGGMDVETTMWITDENYPKYAWYPSGRELTLSEKAEKIDGLFLCEWVMQSTLAEISSDNT